MSVRSLLRRSRYDSSRVPHKALPPRRLGPHTRRGTHVEHGILVRPSCTASGRATSPLHNSLARSSTGLCTSPVARPIFRRWGSRPRPRLRPPHQERTACAGLAARRGLDYRMARKMWKSTIPRSPRSTRRPAAGAGADCTTCDNHRVITDRLWYASGRRLRQARCHPLLERR